MKKQKQQKHNEPVQKKHNENHRIYYYYIITLQNIFLLLPLKILKIMDVRRHDKIE